MAATAEITRFIAEYGINARDHLVVVDAYGSDWEPNGGEYQVATVFVADQDWREVGTLTYEHSDLDTAWDTAYWLADNLGKLEVHSA
jgi:hypothetical protein